MKHFTNKTTAKIFALTVLCLAGSTKCKAYDFEVDGIYYNIISATDMTVEVTSGKNKYKGDFVIPSTVKYNECKFRVSQIGYRALYDCEITSVEIPNTVTYIGEWAFYNCYYLTSVDLPNSISKIGRSAFDDCVRLKSASLPTSVTHIGEAAFMGCRELSDINIPESVVNIEKFVFYRCSNLASLVLPNTISEIPEHMLEGCSKLTSVNIPTSVKILRRDSFCDCTSLESITIPQNVTTIYGGSFIGCTNLSTIKCLAKKPPYLCSTGVYSDYGEIFTGGQNLMATLYVPKGCSNAYREEQGWNKFVNIKEIDAPDNITSCAKPMISYANNKITFSSDTEGAEYHYTITTNDVKGSNVYSDGTVNLEACYNITAYATADGHTQSETATATLYWLDGSITTSSNAIRASKRGVVVSSNDGIVCVSGLEDNENVQFYDVAGKLLGNVLAIQGTAQFAVNTTASILIVKVGDSSLKISIK